MTSFVTRSAFDVEALVKGERHYQWGAVKKPFTIERRGTVLQLKKGDRIGIRLSSSKKFYRVVSEKLGLTKVFTLPLTPQSKAIMEKGVDWSQTVHPTSSKRKAFKGTIPFSVNPEAAAHYAFNLFLSSVKMTSLKSTIKKVDKGDLYPGHIVEVLYDFMKPMRQTFSALGNWFDIFEQSQTKVLYAEFPVFCRAVFKPASGVHQVVRWTHIKTPRPLKEEYVFKLDTSRKAPIQSWSLNEQGLYDFDDGSKYLLKGTIPAKLALCSLSSWRTLKSSLKIIRTSLDSLVRTWVSKNLGAEVLAQWTSKKFFSDVEPQGSMISFIVMSIVDSISETIDHATQHDAEDEVVVDVSTAFKIPCEVIRVPTE